MDRTISAIKEAATGDDFVRLFCSTPSGINRFSHKIFQISPKNKNRLLSSCKIAPVSRCCCANTTKMKTNAAAEIYFALSGLTDAATLRGHLFERQVLNHLFRTGFEYNIRGLTDSNKVWSGHEARPFTFEDLTFFNELTKAVMKKEPLHLVPSARNFAAVDSILYNPNDLDAVFTCIQVTVNRKQHAVSVEGLRKIQSYLKRDTLLNGLRPSKKRPWRFVFVVQSPKASTFEPQEWIGDTPKGEWAGKVHQYVLGLKEETIFEARSDSIVQHATTSQQGYQQVRC
jgi:hypothetical protein